MYELLPFRINLGPSYKAALESAKGRCFWYIFNRSRMIVESDYYGHLVPTNIAIAIVVPA